MDEPEPASQLVFVVEITLQPSDLISIGRLALSTSAFFTHSNNVCSYLIDTMAADRDG
jgi:hypothetical protein